MERLTERTTDGIVVKEDYGEKVLKTIYECYGAEPSPHYANCAEGYCAMEKLAEYEDMEEQGRIVKLPCNIGDTVYRIWSVGGKRKIADFVVTDFRYLDCKWFVMVVKNQTVRQWEFELFENVVFTNKSKAEQALQEMKQEQS